MYISKLLGFWYIYCIYINFNGYEKYLDKINLNIGVCSIFFLIFYMLLILGIL